MPQSDTEQRIKALTQTAGEHRWRDALRWHLPPGAMDKVRGRRSEGMGGLGQFVLRFRIPIGILLVILSGFMLWGVSKVTMRTEFADFFPRTHPYVQLYEKNRHFGGAQTLVIMLEVKHGTIFNVPTLKKIREIDDTLQRLDGVNHNEVFSLGSFREGYAIPVPGGVDFKTYMNPGYPHTEAGVKALAEHVFAHRQALRQLVSDNNKATLFTAAFNERGLDYAKLFNEARGIAKKYSDNNTSIYLAGEPMVRGWGYHYLPQITACFIVAVLAMIVLLYLSLGHRSIWWVPIVTGTLSATWGLGFVGWMGYNFDPVMLVIPFILTARDLSHGIQWQGRYYNELDASGDKYVAIVATTNYMLPPGFLSIIADIAGIIFVSLGGIPILHHIGLAGAVWLASTLTMVFVFEPIFLSFSPVPRLKGEAYGERMWASMPRFFKTGMEKLVEIPVTPGRLRGGLLVVAAIIMIWGITAGDQAKIGYDTPGTPLYRPNAKVNRDIQSISRHFPVDEGWVILNTQEYTKNVFPGMETGLSPDVLRMEDNLRDYLLLDPRITQVVSFSSSVLKPFNQMLHNGYPKFFAVPNDLFLAGQLWYIYLAGSAPGEMEHFFDSMFVGTSCVRILMRDHTYTTLADLVKSLGQFKAANVTNRAIFTNKVHFRYLGGISGLYAAANDVLFRLDIINITFVLIVIFVFSVLAFRSFVAGVLFVLSCILANFAAFIYMRVRDIGLTIDTLPVISLGIGLGVDYGIYTVARIQDEVIRGLKLDEAVVTGISQTGAAVFATFAVMIGGVIPWAFSPLLFHNEMSLLLTFLMFTNMLAGVLILPAFIAWSRPRFVSKYVTEGEKPSAASAMS